MTRLQLTSTFALVLAHMGCMGVAWAAELRVADLPTFNELDRNRDGQISREEAAALPGLLERFQMLDQNGDGRLSPLEYAGLAGPTGRFHEPANI